MKQHGNLYIPSLDGIRALAVGLVFLAHAGLNDRVPGNFGVTVFFFLSGYLITTLLRIEYDNSGHVNLGAFYLRRVLRILPPLYLVLGAATLLSAIGLLGGAVLDPWAVLAQVAHLSNYYIVQNGWWYGRAPGTWIYWSLAVEEHFYLLFPLAYIGLRRFVPSRNKQFVILMAACAAVLVWRVVLVYALHATQVRTYVSTDTRLDSILFGCALAVFGNPVLDKTRVGENWWKFVWVPLGLAALLVSFLVRDGSFEESIRYSLQGLGLFPLFVAAIRYSDWLPFRLLNLGWIKFLGVLSYSFYLLHPTVLFAVAERTAWPQVVQGVVSLGIVLVLATAIYYLVERPCANLRRRLSRIGARPKPAAHSSVSATPALATSPARAT